jgi:hypothetical protein
MRELQLLLASTFLAGLLTACGGGGSSGPCEGSNPDPTCDLACGSGNPCPFGFYCAEDGTCNAECTQDGSGCGGNEYCDPEGHCQALVDADCPNVTLGGSRTTPTVQLLLDQSGSMTAAFGSTDRWEAMKDALTGTNGVVTTTQASVIFGASLYTGTAGTCPQLTSVPRALDNHPAIDALLEGNDPASETPTGESIDVVVDDFIANPPPADSTPIIILATDGEPDTCAVPNPQNGQPEAVAAATRSFNQGIRLYILSVGNDVGAPHLQDMANAGIGNDPQVTGVDAEYFVADNPAELAAALEQLVGGIISCELNLDGAIDPAAAASGVVVLNGMTLVFGVDWEIVDADTIRLIGAACDTLLNSSTPEVSATFPCGVVVE